jgi:hypothetical protein
MVRTRILTIITIGPSLTDLRGTQLTGSISYTLVSRNAQSKPHSDPHDLCTLSLLYQLPNCNLFTQHVLSIL